MFPAGKLSQRSRDIGFVFHIAEDEAVFRGVLPEPHGPVALLQALHQGGVDIRRAHDVHGQARLMLRGARLVAPLLGGRKGLFLGHALIDIILFHAVEQRGLLLCGTIGRTRHQLDAVCLCGREHLLQRLLHAGVHKLLAVAAVAAHAGKLRCVALGQRVRGVRQDQAPQRGVCAPHHQSWFLRVT